jgi:cytochrome bd ubiquinol oxidase subunit I
LLMYEALTAFFLEGGFIGIVLFGEARVGRRMHFFACCMVALGTLLSAFWVLAANSWMQTPQGATLGSDKLFHVDDWARVIFNPSFPYRFAHMVCASYITGVFVVAGVSAIFLLRKSRREFAETGLSMAMWIALFLVPLQMALGDQHGQNTRKYQPMKLAAIEARWDTASSVPLTLFAWPDQKAATNLWAIDVPYLGSLILTHSLHGTIEGLKQVPPQDRPYVPIVFFAFRAMVGIGMLLLSLSLLGAYLRWRRHLFTERWFLVALVLASPLSFIAIISGWIVTEAGRQPWVVYGALRTADAASPLVAADVGVTTILFIIVYTFLLGGFLWFFLRTIIQSSESTSLADLPLHSARGRMQSTPELFRK